MKKKCFILSVLSGGCGGSTGGLSGGPNGGLNPGLSGGPQRDQAKGIHHKCGVDLFFKSIVHEWT